MYRKSEAPQYLQLNKGGSVARMACLQMRAHEHNQPRPPSQAQDWRKARSWGFHNWASAYAALSGGTNDGDAVWVTHCGEYFRNEVDAHDVLSNLHHGWFTDVDQRDTAIGIVASLSHGRFIAGYRWTSNDERVYFGQVYDDQKDAAHAADSHAECFADVAREDDEKYNAQALRRIDYDDALTRLRECIALRHHECMSYVRSEVSELIETMREIRDELRGTDHAV